MTRWMLMTLHKEPLLFDETGRICPFGRNPHGVRGESHFGEDSARLVLGQSTQLFLFDLFQRRRRSPPLLYPGAVLRGFIQVHSYANQSATATDPSTTLAPGIVSSWE